MNYKLTFILLLILLSCNKRPSDVRHYDTGDSIEIINNLQTDSLDAAQKNYWRSMVHREFDEDSLLIDLPDLKRTIRSIILKSKKVKEKEYGTGDYFGKYRVYADKYDTLVIDKGDGGDYGFGNSQYMKRNDSLVFYRSYEFSSTYWMGYDSITERIIEFKKNSMTFLQRAMKTKDWRELTFGNIKFDTIDQDPNKQYQVLQYQLRQLFKRNMEPDE